MARNETLELLRRCDPAQRLEPVPMQERSLLRDRIVGRATPRRVVHERRPRLLPAIASMTAAVALLGVGVAWAAGTWSPLALFQANPQHDNGSIGSLWNQQVLPDSVTEVRTLDLPNVGTVGFFYGDTAQHGWCSALRLPSGHWVGTGKDSLDAGGTVPGCWPTREQVNAAGTAPVYVIDGFDYQEGDVDARPPGGSFWRIRYGQVTAPGAVRVTDLVSGRSAPVVHDNLFVLAVPDPYPMAQTPVHLMAYDDSGRIVADDSSRP
jgi:hypothetical protein